MKRKTVARLTLEHALERVLPDLQAHDVLDVGSRDARYAPLLRYKRYTSLDISSVSRPDVRGDVHALPFLPQVFDLVMATEVLEHLHTPQQAVDEIRRVLLPGGTCVLSTRFIHPYHADPHDYFRFTSDGLKHLFREFAQVEVDALGNRRLSLWLLATSGRYSQFLNYLSPAVVRMSKGRDRSPCGLLVVARR